MPIITGSENPDVLVGTLGDDTIVALGGDDSVVAGRGDNIIFGNQGNDILRAGRGQDTLLGGRDNDQLFGNEQNNILSGDVGDDTLFAVDGENFLFGNDGSDVLVAGLGNDFLYGGQGDDTIWAERGNNVVSGDRGADVLIGGTGENIFVININQGGPEIADAEQILRFKANDKLALVGGPDGQTLDKSAINIAFVRTDANSTRGNYVLSNLATGEFLAVIRNVRRSVLTDESFTEEIVPSDTPDPGPPQPPVVDPDDELPPAPDPGDTTTEPQPPPTPGPGTPPVIEPPVDEDDPDDPADPGDPDDPADPDDPDDPVDPIDPEDNTPPTVDDKELEPDLDLKTSRRKEAQLTGNDIDGQDLTFEIVTQPSNGTIPSASFNASTGEFTYFPNVGFLGEDTFEYRAFDGIAYSDKATITVNVSVSSPIIDLDTQETGVDTSATYIESQGAVNVAGSNIFLAAPNNEITEVKVTLVDPEGNQTLGLDGSVATAQGINVTGDDSPVLTLTGASLGAAAYQAVIETIEFDDDNKDPNSDPRTVNFVVTDNAGDTASATSTITVTPVNDPPDIAVTGPPPQPTKDVAFNLDGVLGDFVDPDVRNGQMTLTLSVSGAAGGTLSAPEADLTVADNNTANVTIQGTLTQLNDALNAGDFTYTAAEEGEAEINVTLNDQGNTGVKLDGSGNPLAGDSAQEDTATITLDVTDIQFEGIQTMTLTNYSSSGDRKITIPATAFLKSGSRSEVDSISEVKDIENITENKISLNGGEIEFNLAGIKDQDSGKFTYTLDLNSGDKITETVTVNYSPGDHNYDSGPIEGSGDANVLAGGARSQTLIGNSGDDYLIGFKESNILYGGSGNDTLAGPEDPNDNNKPDTFVFDRSDFLTGQGFNATDIDAIRNHPHYNTITTFNWGNGKEWREGPSGSTKDQDVIQLSNFSLNMSNVRTEVLSGASFSGDVLTGDERIFAVQSLSADEDATYILYDATGDNTQDKDTYIIAKLSADWAGDETLLAPGSNLTDFDLSFATFTP